MAYTSANAESPTSSPAAGSFAATLHPGMALRLAVIDIADTTLLASARVTERSADAAEAFADFEQMLASLRFR
jgi:hypothetical protein